MPYTVPLKALPTSYPSPAAPVVEDSKRPTPELHTLLVQIRDYLKAADAALREIEP